MRKSQRLQQQTPYCCCHSKNNSQAQSRQITGPKTTRKGNSSNTSRVSSSCKKIKTKRSTSASGWKKQKTGLLLSSTTKNTKRKVKQFIPESIKYRQQPPKIYQDKQNLSYPSNQQLLNGSGLLKCNKPTRINYLAKISVVYELAISGAKLPQFVEYFLGEALYLIYKGSQQTLNSSCYDWKMEEFKQVSENIYNHSEEEDLQYFMSLRLPEINKWGASRSKGLGEGLTVTTQMMSRLHTVSSKPGTSLDNNLKPTPMEKIGIDGYVKNTNESRFTFMEGSRGINYMESSKGTQLGTRERLNYFKSLVRRQPRPVQIEKDPEDVDALSRVEKKLDQYFSTAMNAIGRTNHIV